MASHAKHAVHATNGNGNGHGGNMTQRKIEALLSHHEGIAAALRTTLAVLRGDAVAERHTRAPGILAAAVSLDAARRQYKTKGYQGAAAVKARRQRTADLLSYYDLHKPLGTPPAGYQKIGVLIQHGFLKKVRGGYVRTTKQFTV